MSAISHPADLSPVEAIERLRRRISEYGTDHILVAFSGGVDSAVVLAIATRALKPSTVTAVTALSPSLPAGELSEARAVARLLGVEHRTVETAELGKEAYTRNDANRCFHCKLELYSVLEGLTNAGLQGPLVLSGANADDRNEFRPGLLAAKRFRVRSPLLEEGIGKVQIRALARELGLPVAEKPALACLSSRVAHGLRITPELLRRIDKAERAIRLLGFGSVRVRHFGQSAVIEVPQEIIDKLLGHRGLLPVVDEMHGMGWPNVTVDLAGLRSGSMNSTVAAPRSLTRALHRVGR